MRPPRCSLPNRSAARGRCPLRAFFPATGSPLISDFLFLAMRFSALTLLLATARASEAMFRSRRSRLPCEDGLGVFDKFHLSSCASRKYPAIGGGVAGAVAKNEQPAASTMGGSRPRLRQIHPCKGARSANSARGG